ncbi:MAG TPA: ABC transporter permease subunit, partial [Stellaceae bacterium]|nr:ABC transporter permease subunit [Stellaceae bacterium]
MVARASESNMSAGRTAGFDAAPLLFIPAALVVVALFLYPFGYGLVLSLTPAKGDVLANYERFFGDQRLWQTISTTLWIALPATLINVGASIPIAFVMRHPAWYQRALTTLLVVPVTLGTVLVAEGLLTYLGPQGWFNRLLLDLHLIATPVRLTHNYWGVLLSLVITGFPFAFLLILSYLTGIDPSLARAAATLGARPGSQFRHIYLPLLAPGLAITFCL